MPSLPYTPVVAAGRWLAVSGQVGSRDGSLVDGGLRPELEQALANLRFQLEGAGASLADVVKTTVYLVDMDDYPAMNELYATAFGDSPPARSAVAVAGLPFGARVEIDAWARKPTA